MMYFLSGLPRSGSTLLASLLNQRPDTFASTTSNLCDVMSAAVKGWVDNPATKASGAQRAEFISVLSGILNNRYASHQETYIFDKSRSWPDPEILSTLLDMQDDSKIIATVRPIADCLASFVRIAKPDTVITETDVKNFCRHSPLAQGLFASYAILKAGYEKYPTQILFIEYDQLCCKFQEQMDRISDFLNMPSFKHDPLNVEPSGEIDEVWNIKGLHDVRPIIGKQKYSARIVLGDGQFEFYQGGEFWNDKPNPIRKVDALDLQLEASLKGDFKTSAQIIESLLRDRPECNRVAFNASWHFLHNRELQKGHRYLDKGRDEDVFGSKCDSGQPKWNGESGTVLLNLEGGLGDQIHGYRFAQDIECKGNKVVISCSPELAPIFAEKFISVQHQAAMGVYHDHWVPSMSAVRPLGYEYSDLDGSSYIQRTAQAIPGRVGVRWAGNPQFEHQQHRLFPPELMFDVVKGFNCVSLQRDEGADLKPNWMPQAEVSNWEATRKSVSECELVITSCTSIAHLAGAMGIEVWIILPILPYYLWALPGNKSPYYDSATLFRQEQYGDWSGPFKSIKEKLKCMHMLKMAA